VVQELLHQFLRLGVNFSNRRVLFRLFHGLVVRKVGCLVARCVVDSAWGLNVGRQG
jgi:hypothetical protein